MTRRVIGFDPGKNIYRQRLYDKYGNNRPKILGRLHGFSQAIRHRCGRCGNIFHSSPKGMLYNKVLPWCNSCSFKLRAKPHRKSQRHVVATLANKFPQIKMIGYITNHQKARLRCLNCQHVWQQTSYELFKLKHGCPQCARIAQAKARRFSQEEFCHKLYNINPYIAVLGKYAGNAIPLEVECLRCSTIWQPTPNNLLNGAGCYHCRGKYKSYQLGGRTLLVQGYEDRALDFLRANPYIADDEITVFSEGKIPRIAYRMAGKMRYYQPDIMVGNIIYEVKSTYTLYSHDSLRLNQTKARACKKRGYEFNLLLVNSAGDIVELPNSWLSWSEIKAKHKCKKWENHKLRILGIDPGSVNMAWAVVETNGKAGIRIIAHGTIDHPVNDLTKLTQQTEIFIEEIYRLVSQYNIAKIVAERFLPRGIKGATIEKINYMLGAIDVLIREPGMGGQFKLITPAQWKNRFNRISSLDNFYRAVPIIKHQIDAVCIAIYGLNYWTNSEYFKFMTSPQGVNKFKQQLLTANTGKLINRRIAVK